MGRFIISEPEDIINVTKSRRMHVQEINVFNILTEDLDKVIEFVTFSCRWV